jgi:micrococcal nuclease
MDNDHTNELRNNDFKNMKELTFEGMITQAKVVDVYDGDTVTIVFYYNDMPIKHKFRIYGCDTPELKPKLNILNREEHVQAAKCVKEYVTKLLMNKIVWIKFTKKEKYGRLMGNIYLDNQLSQNVSDMIIKNGYSKPYYGGRKKEFTEDELKKIVKSV